jgi:hypothetical protein
MIDVSTNILTRAQDGETFSRVYDTQAGGRERRSAWHAVDSWRRMHYACHVLLHYQMHGAVGCDMSSCDLTPDYQHLGDQSVAL